MIKPAVPNAGWLGAIPPGVFSARPGVLEFAGQLTAALEGLGVASGDRVVSLLPHSETLFLSTLVCAESAIAAPLAIDTPVADVHAHWRKTEAKVALVHAGLPRAYADVYRHNGVSVITIADDLELGVDQAGSGASPVSGNAGPGSGAGVLLQTSGTLGEPKLVLLGTAQLRTVAERIAQSLQLQADDRYLCVMPCHFIHGLSTALAAVFSGGEVVFAHTFEADAVLQQLASERISWVSAAPTHYRSLLAALEKSPRGSAPDCLRLVRTASAPMHDALLEQLQSRLAVPVIQAYGMTEAGPLIASNTLADGGNRPGSVGRPVGVEVVIGQPGLAAEPRRSGAIWIRGETVTARYWSLESTQETAPQVIAGWFQTGDVGHFDEDGFLYVTGRTRELINAGGEKLLPTKIEAALLRHPAVVEAVAYPAPHDSLGEAPHAAVVIGDGVSPGAETINGPDTLAEEIRQFCVSHLPRSHLPHRVILCRDIPRNAGGKLQRQGLHAYFSRQKPDSRRDPATDYSGEQLRESLTQCWRRVLRGRSVAPGDNFFSLGGDSLSAAELAMEIDQAFGLNVGTAFVFLWPTIEQQAREVAARSAGAGAHSAFMPAAWPPSEQRARLGEFVPLSPGQKRLWLLDQLGAGAAYNMCAAVWIDGQVDRATLRGALSDVVARHGVLRTRIRMLDGQPIQYLEPALIPTIGFSDLRGTGPGNCEERALAIAQQERARAFDLSGPAPVRYQLLQLEENRYAFVLTIHHLICDGWSVPVFFRDLLVCYQHRSGESTLVLPVPGAQFADHCHAQQAAADSPVYADKLNWWRGALAEAARELPLFTSAPQGGRQVTRSAQRPFNIDAETIRRLRELAGARGLSLYPLLLAALQVAVYAHTGRAHFCVGAVSANRDRREYDQCMGFFANTLAIPAHVEPDVDLLSWLDTVAATCQRALAHGEVDLSHITGLLPLERDGRSSTLVEVMFAYQNFPSLAARLDGLGSALKLTPFTVPSDESRFALSLYVTPEEQHLAGSWQYQAASFSAPDIERIDIMFQTTLRALAAPGRLRIGELLNLAVADTSVRKDPACVSEAASIVTRIEAFSRSTPQAIAIRSGSSALSYADLAREIKRLASVLRDGGAVPGSRFAVLLPRSAPAVIAPLAIWSCGATYVPLDADLPVARLKYMVENAGVQGLISVEPTRELAAQLAGITGVHQLVDFDQAADGDEFRPVEVSSDGCAYIIYTSGSTGVPKGVEISFGNIDHYFQTLPDALGLRSDDLYLLSASLSFSSSIRQLALPLYSGACVCVASEEDLRNAARLPQMVAEAGITILDLVPSHWRSVLRAASLSAPDAADAQAGQVRLLLSASEALTADLAAAVSAAYPQARLINMYGQTETAGIVLINAHAHCAPADRYVPLGQPLPGNRVAIVDSHSREVPQGTPGELVIMGPAVGLGYVPGAHGADSRFGSYSGERAYRSGDLVRADSGGNIHFVGRVDTQLKHRGFRIEPGDIESTAREHPLVHHAVACLSRSDDLAERLQLYYSLEPAAGENDDVVTDLKALLAEQLPGYMLPSVYTRLASMPLTPSGKVDRGALSGYAEPAVTVEPEAAADGALIARLCSIWQRVLGTDSVGPDDNFFDIGGNSLASIDVVSEARNAGIALSLEQLFQHQTISALAAVLEPSAGSRPAAVRSKPKPPSDAPKLGVAEAEQLPRYDIESLRNFSVEVLRKAGLAEEGVHILTDVQLESSLRGQVTHNIGDIPRYAKRLSQGVLNASPQIEITDATTLSATVDGDNAPGQWVATVAMDKAMALARAHGVGVVGVRRSNHYGAAGQYAWQAARAGLIGLCFTNGPVILAPTGGNEPLFGNNPLAVGIPRHNTFPVILDMAMSVATRGKIGLTVAEGRPLDAGWILDSLGRPSTSLEDLAAGLAAPIGGHKGYGLAFVIEILAGALTGSGYCADHRGKAAAAHGGSDIGHLFIALKPELLMPLAAFTKRVEDVVAQTKTSRKVDGVEEIFIPGEIEMRARARNLLLGIPLHASTLKRLRDYARRYGVGSEIIKAHGPQGN